MKTCDTCIKWLFKTEEHNGVFGKCSLHKFWCNEKYGCSVKSKSVNLNTQSNESED